MLKTPRKIQFSDTYTANLAKILVFSIYPVALFYGHNYRQQPNILSLFFCFLLVFGAGALTFFAYKVIFRRFSGRWLVDCFAVFVFFFFNYMFFKNEWALAGKYVWAASLLAGLFVTALMSRFSGFSQTILLFGCLMIPVNFIQPLVSVLMRGDVRKESVNLSSDHSNKSIVKPNVYWLVLDGYARSDVLSEVFSYDNKDFLNELKSRGYYIAEKSYANFPLTYLSLSNSLAGEYLLVEGRRSLRSRLKFYDRIYGNNKTVRFFKSQGYSFVHYENSFWAGSRCGHGFDVCLNSVEVLNETELELLRMTPIFRFVETSEYYTKKLEKNGLGRIHDWIKNRSREVASPHFMFAHVVTPHAPYFHDDDCSVLDNPQQSLVKWDKRLYINEVRCVSPDVLKIVGAIQNLDKDALVLLQSDHGSATRDQLMKDPQTWTYEDFRERYAILNAIKLPQACSDLKLYESISPINNLNVIKACLGGVEPSYLPDHSYFATYEGKKFYGLISRMDKESGRPLAKTASRQ